MLGYRDRLHSEDFLKVVFVGDMQTSQPYSKPNWTDWLQRTLWENGEVQTSWRRKVINAGIDRATPRHVFTYYTEYIGQYKPDLVVLSFGVTPVFPQYNEKIFSNELEQLLDTLHHKYIEVVLWSPYPLLNEGSRAATLSLRAIFKEKAVVRNLQFIDLYNEFENVDLSKIMTYTTTKKNELFQMEVGNPDGISLNNIGTYLVARKMANDLFKLALPGSAGSFEIPQFDMARHWG
ncbi:SGNH/GDSL hydrolase family protein [bacterium]|nr:SGNH/GDSL hydrolase family protein [bacterium]